MAPEVVKKEPYNGPSIDLFAAGVILFIMKYGLKPFEIADPEEDEQYKLLLENTDEYFKNQKNFVQNDNFAPAKGFKDVIKGMLLDSK